MLNNHFVKVFCTLMNLVFILESNMTLAEKDSCVTFAILSWKLIFRGSNINQSIVRGKEELGLLEI